MKTKKMTSLLLGITLSVGCFGLLSAQDKPAELPPQTVNDGGAQAITQAQNAPEIKIQKKVSATSELNKWAKAQNFQLRWDKEKKRIITIGSAMFDCADPGKDKDFFEKRQMAAIEAILKAKAKIIEFCNQEMEAMDRVSTPGTDLNKQFGQRAKEIEAALLLEKEKLAKICEQFDKAKADELRGTTFTDRLDDLMVAIIKKINEDYNPDAKDEKLKARVAEIQGIVLAQQEKIKELEKEAKIAAGKLKKEKESMVETMASMPLYGATALKYLESFNGKRVEVAVAMVWSITLERVARAIVTGEQIKLKPDTNRATLDAWIAKKNLGDMAGPLQYLDNLGRRHFIGICAADYGEELSSSTLDDNKMFAEQFAKSATAFSIKGDVESYKLAKQMMKTYDVGGKDEDKIAKAMQSTLSQNLKSNFNGLGEIAADEYTNSISGRNVWVSVYAIDPDAAKDAIEIEDINVATKVKDNIHQAETDGRNAVNKAVIEESKNNPDAFQNGAAKQGQVLRDKLLGQPQQQPQQQPADNKKPEIKNNQQPPAQVGPNGKPAIGVFGDTDRVDDDF